MTETFIGRKNELAQMEELWQKSNTQAQFLVLYGKRRVGKTELVKEFLKDKDHIFYLSGRTSAKEELSSATETIFAGLGENYLSRGAFNNWRQLFDYLGGKLALRDKPIVLVFDEFPFLAESQPAISSLFQYGWEQCLKDKKVFLILLGSSIKMMYKHALNYSAPLFGRRTASILLEPFSYLEASEFFDPKASFVDKFSLYSLVGGIPAYLRQMTIQKSLEENIVSNFLQKGAFLNLEPEYLLADEFPEPNNYLTILKGVGMGRTRSSELLNLTGIEVTKLPYYLKTLIDLRLIKREIPITEKNPENSKKSNYSIADLFLRFYFSFVFPNRSNFASGDLSNITTQQKLLVNQIIAKSYEDSSQEFIKKAIKQKKLPQFFEFGRWWDKNNEIDLVGLNSEENSILFVEVKWNNAQVDIDIFWKLVERSELVNWGEKGRKKYYALISKSGFTKQMEALAKERAVVLICEGGVVP
jgi:AAA+ ATPase superfamily predicted ATPase